MDKKCRVCQGSELDVVVHYEKAPRAIERLLRREDLEKDSAVELNVYQCRLCGHVQLMDQLAVDYYDDYLMSHSHLKKMREFQYKQAAAFIEKFKLEGKKVLEVGCGDGQYSLILRELGCYVVSNEPSSKARSVCESKGLTPIAGYLGENSFQEYRGSFDAVFARQVLEHVPDPNDFVRGMRNVMKPDGVGMIEIPSLEQAVEFDRFFDFFPDHLSYFSAASLRHLFYRNSFEVIEVHRAMDGEYNEIWVQRAELPDLNAVQNASKTIAASFETFLSREQAEGRKAAIWGAGGKGVLTLAMVDVSPVAYLIDKDKNKHGQFTPVSHLEVSSPERLNREPVDTVLITALAYKDEIIHELRTQYGFTGRVAFVNGGEIETE